MSSENSAIYFDGNFWGHRKGQTPMRETPLNKTVFWGEDEWHIPSFYTNNKGLTFIFCVKISPHKIKIFLDKWQARAKEENLPLIIEEQIEQENPLSSNYNFSIVINNKTLPEQSSCSTAWNPVHTIEEENTATSSELCDTYGCDKNFGWIFIKASFLWATTRKPTLKSMSLQLKSRPRAFTAAHFFGLKNEEINILHPVTKELHTLKTLDCKQDKMSDSQLENKDFELPLNYSILEYTLFPEIEKSLYAVQDCETSDMPKSKKNQDKNNACSVGIIGGSCGAIVIGNDDETQKIITHKAFSALHFEPTSKTQWRLIFWIKDKEDLDVWLTF